MFFKRAYKNELSLRKRADLYSIWDAVKPGVLDVVKAHGLRSLSTSSSSRKLLKKLEHAIEKEIPSLRRKIDFASSFDSEDTDSRGEIDGETSSETTTDNQSAQESENEENRLGETS